MPFFVDTASGITNPSDDSFKNDKDIIVNNNNTCNGKDSIRRRFESNRIIMCCFDFVIIIILVNGFNFLFFLYHALCQTKRDR